MRANYDCASSDSLVRIQPFYVVLGLWCNGNIIVSKSIVVGSIPARPLCLYKIVLVKNCSYSVIWLAQLALNQQMEVQILLGALKTLKI